MGAFSNFVIGLIKSNKLEGVNIGG